MPDEKRAPLRVAIPMLTLVPEGMGGTETYAREIICRLEQNADLELVRYVSRRTGGHTGHGSGAEVVVDRVLGGSSTPARLRTLITSSAPPLAQRLYRKADVVHFPFTVPAPFPRKTPYVTTLHDMGHRDVAQCIPWAERALRRLTYEEAAKRADAVITDSEFSKHRIRDLLAIPPDRIRVAYLAASPAFEPPSSVEVEPFVIYPARRFAHKNHARLIEAMHLVRAREPAMRLVLTGGGPHLLDVPPWVEQRGFVSEVELCSLYQRAACLAFPSLYEGFGMPVIEAMASGCPSAVSTAAALPEICGDAAIHFDPFDPRAMAEAILTAIRNRARLTPLGVANARRFSWDACAADHADVYRQVGARSL